jgi:SAM-dependent methyltransferase
MRQLDYVSIDLDSRPLVNLQGDVTALPLAGDSFDAIICIHVLEHVDDDRAAMNELFRVLKPGAWALITVPMMLDRPTFEDPTITEPEQRKEAFGETSHVRYYGRDVVERLEASGFVVTVDLGADIDPDVMNRHGLLPDENVLYCVKPLAST